MKPSNNAMFDYFLGIIVIVIALPLAIVWNNMTIFALALAATNMLFIFGIQQDLYERKDKLV